MWNTRIIFVLLPVFCLICISTSAQNLESRLKEHYVGKAVEIKLPVPHAKSPMLVYPRRENMFDLKLWEMKLEKAGLGLEPGVIAVIKDVELDNREVMFTLIGVGFEYPTFEIPVTTLSEKIWDHGSGKIKFKSDRPIAEESNPITTINTWLSNVAIAKYLISEDELSEEIQREIKDKIISRGMSRKAVYIVLGDPAEILKELKENVLIEAWIYEREDFTSLMVVFHDGRVEIIKEF